MRLVREELAIVGCCFCALIDFAYAANAISLSQRPTRATISSPGTGLIARHGLDGPGEVIGVRLRA
jgi:hypothetical protein